MSILTAAVILLALAGFAAYVWDDLFQTLETASKGGEPQADYHGLEALRWVDVSSPPLGAVLAEGADGNLPAGQTADGRHPL